jgi:hypothetical protein
MIGGCSTALSAFGLGAVIVVLILALGAAALVYIGSRAGF